MSDFECAFSWNCDIITWAERRVSPWGFLPTYPGNQKCSGSQLSLHCENSRRKSSVHLSYHLSSAAFLHRYHMLGLDQEGHGQESHRLTIKLQHNHLQPCEDEIIETLTEWGLWCRSPNPSSWNHSRWSRCTLPQAPRRRLSALHCCPALLGAAGPVSRQRWRLWNGKIQNQFRH